MLFKVHLFNGSDCMVERQGLKDGSMNSEEVGHDHAYTLRNLTLKFRLFWLFCARYGRLKLLLAPKR